MCDVSEMYSVMMMYWRLMKIVLIDGGMMNDVVVFV